MKANEKTAEKSIVSQLNFGKKTIQRVTWESWSFRIAGPLQVEVTNEAYGYLRDEHRYVVACEEADGLVIPRECECKADLYNENYDCKHKVALATVGGPVILRAAAGFPTNTANADQKIEAVTVADKLRPDGGVLKDSVPDADPDEDECDDCSELPGDFPCAGCYISGEKDFPADAEGA